MSAIVCTHLSFEESQLYRAHSLRALTRCAAHHRHYSCEQVIAKHDGGKILVDATLNIFSRPEDKEDDEMAAMQRHALTQAIEALGTIASHLPPATFAPAVPGECFKTTYCRDYVLYMRIRPTI